MQFSSQLLENAVNEFAKLPGIGKKTALRLVLHLLKQEENNVQQFSEVIAKMRNEIKFCQRCYNVADGDICSICANSMRKQETICVVENIRDVIAIESTQQFNGTYHVLGGIISPLDGVGPDQLNIESLINRVQKEKTEEIIFALIQIYRAIPLSIIYKRSYRIRISRSLQLQGVLHLVANLNMPTK